MHEQIIIYVKTIKRIPLFCQNKFLLHKINKSESIRKYQKFLAHQISKSQSILKVSNEVLCSVRISFVHQINKSHSILKVSSEVLCQCQNKFLVHTTIQSILKVSSDQSFFLSESQFLVHQINKSQSRLKISSEVLCFVRISFSCIKSTNHNLY